MMPELNGERWEQGSRAPRSKGEGSNTHAGGHLAGAGGMPVRSRERGLEDLGCLVKEFVLWVLKEPWGRAGILCQVVCIDHYVKGIEWQTQTDRGTAVYTGTFH